MFQRIYLLSRSIVIMCPIHYRVPFFSGEGVIFKVAIHPFAKVRVLPCYGACGILVKRLNVKVLVGNKKHIISALDIILVYCKCPPLYGFFFKAVRPVAALLVIAEPDAAFLSSLDGLNAGLYCPTIAGCKGHRRQKPKHHYGRKEQCR